jgi:hypothetical protein
VPAQTEESAAGVPRQAIDGDQRKESIVAKQTKLPGFTEIEDDKVEDLAEKYREKTDEWLAAQKPALELEKKLKAAVKANPEILKAARSHPKGKVKVGRVLLTLPPPDDDPKIRVKILSEEEGE